MNIERLSISSMLNVADNVKQPHYALGTILPSIVHFGAGNFHRAHQAAYCDALLNQVKLAGNYRCLSSLARNA